MTVKKPRNRSENHVTPVGKPHVSDVRKTEKDRGRPPTGKLALAGTGQHILQQSAEENFLRPRGKEKDGDVPEGNRWPRVTESPNGIVSILLQKHIVVVDINRGVVVRQDERMLCHGGSVGPNQLCHSAHGLVVWNPATGEKRPIG